MTPYNDLISGIMCNQKNTHDMSRRSIWKMLSLHRGKTNIFASRQVVVGRIGGSQAQSKVEMYSESSGWKELPPLPTARLRSAVVAGNLQLFFDHS